MHQVRPTAAVIGSGIAGLTAARELDRTHAVTLYEADGRIGGHTNTVRVDDPRGECWVDTGFIVHNGRNYPTFCRLLEELGVESQDAEMGMSITTGDGKFEFANTRRGLFAQRSNLLRPRFWGLIRDQLRFNREVRPLIGRADTPSVGEFLRDSGYSRWFCERAVIPEISAVWSSGQDAIWEFPLGFLAEFLDNHGQLELTGRPRWRTIPGGSRVYVERLLEGFGGEVRAASPVLAIGRRPDAVEVIDPRESRLFDEVVIATHSDQALAMLESPTAAEHQVLGAMDYQPNEAVLHTDASLMPKRRRAWASWNFHLDHTADGPTAVTYWMNNLQHLEAERNYFVTLNLSDQISEDATIATIPYAHPAITHRSVAAQARWAEISGVDRIHYCGAYWRWGFHEDGCWSAMRACEALRERGASRPALLLAA